MSELLFTKNHAWINKNGNTALIGISNYAQLKLKTILFLNLPEADGDLVSGEKYGDIESIKTVSDLISPVTGKILKVNEDLMDDPSAINELPHECWFLEVEVVSLAEELLTEEEYEEYCNTL